MNLLVVGNGFDLNQNYSTSYTDFSKFMLEILKKEESDFINDCIVIKKSSVLYEKLRKMYSFVRENKTKNFFLSYFINFNYKINYWCDFEEEIQRILVHFDWFLQKAKNENAYDVSESSFKFRSRDVIQFIDILDIAQDNEFCSYQSYLNAFDKADMNWSRLSFSGVSEQGSMSASRYIELLINEIVDKLFEDLQKFSELFRLYLQVITPETINKRDIVDEPYYKRIINYNYTNVAENIFIHNDTEDFQYIHGTINKECSTIFGIDSDVSFNLPQFFQFTKKSLRLSNQTDFRFKIEKYLYSNIDFFGHSFTESDKDSLRDIFKSFKISENSKITIYYYSKEKDAYSINKTTSKLSAKLKIILEDEYDKFSPFIYFEDKDTYNIYDK